MKLLKKCLYGKHAVIVAIDRDCCQMEEEYRFFTVGLEKAVLVLNPRLPWGIVGTQLSK